MYIFYHPGCDIPVPSTHRFVGSKFSDLYNHLQSQPFASKLKVGQPTPAPVERINRAHSSSYIKKVFQDELSKEDLRLINLPWSERLRNRSFLAIEAVSYTHLTLPTN